MEGKFLNDLSNLLIIKKRLKRSSINTEIARFSIVTYLKNVAFPDIATSAGEVEFRVVGEGGIFYFELLPGIIFDKDFIVTEIPIAKEFQVQVGKAFPVSQTPSRKFSTSCTNPNGFQKFHTCHLSFDVGI